MARSSPKKPSAPKCRGSQASVEGRNDVAKIGGHKWLREAAIKAGKFIPIEYREGYVAKRKAEAAPAEAPKAEEAAAETTAE